MAIDPSRVPRFAHGSRVPGWDRAADLSKDPATIPDPATTPVPDELRARIEEYMARYPDRHSAAIPALVGRELGWDDAERARQVKEYRAAVAAERDAADLPESALGEA